MSVEFQTRINEPFLIRDCVEDTVRILDRLLGKINDPRIAEVHLVDGLDAHTTVERGRSYLSFCLAIAEDAIVDVSIYNFEDPAYQEEAGTWLVAEVILRKDLSFVLSLAFAIATARRTRSTVLDDAGLLKLGRHLDPDGLLERLRLPVTPASLEEAASILSQSVNHRFGDR